MKTFAIEFCRLDGPPAIGVDGLVRSLVAVGGGLGLDEARVLGGAAFRTYFLTPDDNHAYRSAISEAEWAWGSLDVENYGVLESLWAHMDRDLRNWTLEKPADLVALARHELDSGRPFIGKLRAGSPEHVVVTAVAAAGRRWEAVPPEGCARPEVVSFDDLSEWDPEQEPQLTGAVTMRPAVEAPPSSRLTMLRRDVLTFVGRHARSRKELHHGEELFYASGLRAWDVAADHLTTRWRDADAEDFAPFWAAWTAAARDGRRSAARVLARWPDADVDLAAAAAAFGAVADAVPVLTGTVDWNNAAVRGPIARALVEARDLDEVAVESLEDALRAGA